MGSVSAVGSWFFNSVTKRVRKSLAVMVAELLLELLELSELLVLSVLSVELVVVDAVLRLSVCAVVL